MARSITRPLRHRAFRRQSLADTLEVLVRHDMIFPLDRPRLTLLLLAAISVGHPHCGPAQQLALTADVGKSVFFEDEPIFLVLRLKNVGSDTVWLLNTVEMSMRRDGAPVPAAQRSIDWVCPRADRCGDPLAPGRSHLTAEILQDRAGEDRDFRRSLFLGHLGPGEYELGVRLGVVEAAPIVFRIRQRTATETRELTELEAIRWMRWDRTHPTNYEGSLIAWVARHPQDDPFLPFLLARWLYGPPPGMIEVVARQANLDLDSLRVAVLEADPSSPAGAYIAQSMAGWRPQQLAALAEPLGASLAGEMARSLAERLP